MMVAFQEAGVVLEITREDGRPFSGTLLRVQYHRSMYRKDDGSWKREVRTTSAENGNENKKDV